MNNPSRTDEFLPLYSRCQRQVYVYLRARFRNASDVDDLVQQVATVLWQKFDEYRRDEDFTRWALGIARVVSLKRSRAAKPLVTNFHEELAELVDAEILAVSQSADLRSDALRQCLDEISPWARSVLQQRYETSKTVSEIAKTFQRSESAVYKSLQKIHDFLYQCVESKLNPRSLS